MGWSPRIHQYKEQKKKYRGMFETQKSGNRTSSEEIGLNIRTPKVGQYQIKPKTHNLSKVMAFVFFRSKSNFYAMVIGKNGRCLRKSWHKEYVAFRSKLCITLSFFSSRGQVQQSLKFRADRKVLSQRIQMCDMETFYFWYKTYVQG